MATCKSKRARTCLAEWRRDAIEQKEVTHHRPRACCLYLLPLEVLQALRRPWWWWWRRRRDNGSFRVNPLQVHNLSSSVSEPGGGDLRSSDGRASRKASRKRPRHRRHKKWRAVSCALRKAAGSLTGPELGKLTPARSTRSAVVRGCEEKGHPTKFEEFCALRPSGSTSHRIPSRRNCSSNRTQAFSVAALTRCPRGIPHKTTGSQQHVEYQNSV